MKSECVKIDVVIPVYENWLALSHLFEPICEWLEVRKDINIIIVDDGSHQQCEELLRLLGEVPQIYLVSHFRNKGRASALNTGYLAGDADYIAFLDVDCVPDKNWLDVFSTNISQGADFVIGNLRSIGEGYWSRYLNEIYNDRAREYLSGSTDFTTPFCMFRRRVLDSVGGFSEDYKKYGFEDRDLIQRLLNNYRLRSSFINDVYAYHAPPSDIDGVLKKSFDSGCSSSRLFSERFPEFYRKTVYWYFDARQHSNIYCSLLNVSLFVYNKMFFLIKKVIIGEKVSYKSWKFLVRLGSALAFFGGSYSCKDRSDQKETSLHD